MELAKLLMAECKTTGDIQAKLKKLFAGTIEQMLEAEMEERLGHEKVQTTMDTYSHLYPGKQAEVATKLDLLMGTAADSQNVASL